MSAYPNSSADRKQALPSLVRSNSLAHARALVFDGSEFVLEIANLDGGPRG
jgi:hypothetical protein